jgi:thiol-disulfide isomerase/thioredoxin
LAIGVVVIGLAYVFRPTPTELGVPLSDLQLQPLVGDVQPLELEDLAGKVVLINFWGTWCPPCRIEFPELARMNGRLKADPDFRFIPVTCPPGRDADFDKLKSATEAYYRSEGFDLTAHYDPGGVTRYTLMQDLQLPSFSFPTSVLLDREGAVQGLWVGYQSGVEAQMETKIKKLLR